MKKSYLIIAALILFSFGLGAYFYGQMPDRMASHWSFQGEPDGHMSKFWALFLMPMVSVFLFLLLLVAPKIDPLKRNIEEFRRYFDAFVVLIITFLFYIYLLTLFWNLGYRFDMGQLMAPAMGVLFYACGILIKNAKRNWFIGIRTPWTLSSDSVWRKTHKLGAGLFKASGLIAFLGILLPQYSFYFIMGPVLFSATFAIVYSYLQYRKEAGE